MTSALLRAGIVAGLGLAAGGCGGSSSADAPASFPAPRGRTLDQLLSTSAAQRSSLLAAPSGEAYSRGRNRFGFGVFTASRQQITDADVALYTAPANGGKALGPFPARAESLGVAPRYRSQTSARDPDSAKLVYVSDVRFPRQGHWNMVAMFHNSDGYSTALMPTIRVGGFAAIPKVGERPPSVHTATAADVNGHLGKIDTRSPHDDMHKVDFANDLGHRPLVLLFATPALCQSRVCGPVVDVAEEVEHEPASKGVDFIHQEVYNHNNASDGYRPQLRAFGLKSEPWLFVVGRKGIIRTRIEGAFSAAELEKAVQQVAPG